jgi:hypothetical protein
MGEFDPVHWETVEATTGPPAPEIEAHVEQMAGEVYEKDPYDAVKTIHDALYAADVERTVPNAGEPFVTAYLLEKRGIIEPESDDETEYRSLVDRRPGDERLEELFWERERTLWWVGVLTGVHPSLVTYWFYEADIPLMERNFTEESLREIREGQSAPEEWQDSPEE